MSLLSQSKQRPTVGWKRVIRRKRLYPIRRLTGRAGQIVKASDRLYRVTANGNLVRGYISTADNKFHVQRRVRNHEIRRVR